jgi:hypothetical protein
MAIYCRVWWCWCSPASCRRYARVCLRSLTVQTTGPIAHAFVMPQYNTTVEGQPITYTHGRLDIAAISYYTVCAIVVHAVIQEYIMDVSARTHTHLLTDTCSETATQTTSVEDENIEVHRKRPSGVVRHLFVCARRVRDQSGELHRRRQSVVDRLPPSRHDNAYKGLLPHSGKHVHNDCCVYGRCRSPTGCTSFPSSTLAK